MRSGTLMSRLFFEFVGFWGLLSLLSLLSLLGKRAWCMGIERGAGIGLGGKCEKDKAGKLFSCFLL